MKKTSIIIFCLGLMVTIFFFSPLYPSITNDNIGGGFGVLLVGYPLIILGIILFIISWIRGKKNNSSQN